MPLLPNTHSKYEKEKGKRYEYEEYSIEIIKKVFKTINEEHPIMGNLNKRMGIISEITKKKPRLGKTAIMKYIFLLQKVYNVPLGYDFEIYTYGPYSSEVMEDIDLAKHQDIISMEMVTYLLDIVVIV